MKELMMVLMVAMACFTVSAVGVVGKSRGATLDIGFVWDVADTFNGLMVVPNLLALFLLSGTLVRILRGELCPCGDCRLVVK